MVLLLPAAQILAEKRKKESQCVWAYQIAQAQKKNEATQARAKPQNQKRQKLNAESDSEKSGCGASDHPWRKRVDYGASFLLFLSQKNDDHQIVNADEFSTPLWR